MCGLKEREKKKNKRMCDTKIKQLNDYCDVKMKLRSSASPNWAFKALYFSSLASNLRIARGKSRDICIFVPRGLNMVYDFTLQALLSHSTLYQP